MRIENLWCVHVRTTRGADAPDSGVGKRVGAILGKSVLLPGDGMPCMGPERDSGSAPPGGARSHQHDRARRACRSAAGLAARGDGFKRAIRGCLCIFRSLIQNEILPHDRA
ncbi:hypothetical protein DID96_04700 [Burkholderia sp. Bp8963]|nr:hypothetical protein DID96_04700 [Burkholderia sp. Bp8963]